MTRGNGAPPGLSARSPECRSVTAVSADGPASLRAVTFSVLVPDETPWSRTSTGTVTDPPAGTVTLPCCGVAVIPSAADAATATFAGRPEALVTRTVARL